MRTDADRTDEQTEEGAPAVRVRNTEVEWGQELDNNVTWPGARTERDVGVGGRYVKGDEEKDANAEVEGPGGWSLIRNRAAFFARSCSASG